MSVDPDVNVVLPVGTVTGKALPNGVKEYLGVPYAQPLETRVSAFEEPKPLTMLRPETSAGLREVDHPYGGGYPELSLFLCPSCTCLVACSYCCRSRDEDTDGKPPTGLNVVRMNIWAPPTDGQKPVMVWIHGGGDAGSARRNDPNSRSGHRLAASQDLVVYTLEFRQGIFGAMDWGRGSDVPTNLELRDMVCGLQWVQAHIGAFGGNHGHRMIFRPRGALGVQCWIASKYM